MANQEIDLAKLADEKDLHEIFRIWEQRYTTLSFDPEPFVRR